MAHPEPIALDPFGSDLPAEMARLRDLGTAVPVALPGGVPAWVITRHAALRGLLLDPGVTKDGRRHWRLWPEVATRPEWAWIGGWVGAQSMMAASGKDHARLRRLIAPSFTRRRIKAMQPGVDRIVNELLDRLAAVPPGETVDLRAAYAHPLPLRVISELLGVPDHMRHDFARLVEALVDTSATPEEAAATQARIEEVIPPLIHHKREHRGDDLTTELIDVRDESTADRLSDEELRDTLLLIIAAGHETTAHLIGNAVHALLTHPDQLRKVLAGDIAWEWAIEETLRWAPSIAAFPLRFAVEPLDVDGVRIPKGDAIMATYLAAGHDPARHGESADRFDASRPPAEHLAFGMGVHRCLGAELARLEAATALPALFTRFPGITPATEEPRRMPSFIVHGFQELPVRLTSAG